MRKLTDLRLGGSCRARCGGILARRAVLLHASAPLGSRSRLINRFFCQISWQCDDTLKSYRRNSRNQANRVARSSYGIIFGEMWHPYSPEKLGLSSSVTIPVLDLATDIGSRRCAKIEEHLSAALGVKNRFAQRGQRIGCGDWQPGSRRKRRAVQLRVTPRESSAHVG